MGRIPALLALLLSSCLRSAGLPVVRPPSAAAGDQLVELARAAGERVRQETGGGFVVYPIYQRGTGYDLVDRIDSAGAPRMKVLLAAFRDGARAHFADTTEFRDRTRAAQLPDSERFYFTLMGEPTLGGDSATVDVLGAKAVPTGVAPEPAEMEFLRYTFRAHDGRWVFVRRTMLWAS